jgi:hypothetical protein
MKILSNPMPFTLYNKPSLPVTILRAMDRMNAQLMTVRVHAAFEAQYRQALTACGKEL